MATANERARLLVSEAYLEIAELNKRLDKYRKTKAKNWGHVGDLGRILELLRQANGKED
ncbi:MAG: hypothetical protein GWN93_06795 [Deltaproteobacteria bacterium]|nr:hypothetical protein [Deltaproteobacteria bacterium]